jgi:hypothetical protein
MMTEYREGPELDRIISEGTELAKQFARRSAWKSVASIKLTSEQLINPHGWDCPCEDCDSGRKELLKDKGVLPTAHPRPTDDEEIDRIADSYLKPEN